MEHEYKKIPKEPIKKTYESKLRVINKKSNSLASSIPKEITELINLKKNDKLVFEVEEKDNKINIDMFFKITEK